MAEAARETDVYVDRESPTPNVGARDSRYVSAGLAGLLIASLVAAPAGPQATAADVNTSRYVTLQPCRLVDTRTQPARLAVGQT